MKKILALLFLFALAWESKGQCEEQAQGNFRPTKQGEEVREKLSKIVDEELQKLHN